MAENENRIIIGGKDINCYMPAVLYKFEHSDEIELCAVGTNISKLERLVRLFTLFVDVKETGRTFEKWKDNSVTVSHLKRGVLDGKK